MGSAAEIREPTTGTEKHHHPVEVEEEEEDEQVVELERKTSSFPHGKERFSTDSSTITTSSSSSFSGDGTVEIPDFHNGEGEHSAIENLVHDEGNNCNVYFDGEQGLVT